MFIMPMITSFPVAGMTTAIGTADWPTLGTFFAWTLIAALVGSGLGLLREGVGQKRLTRRREVPAPDNCTGQLHVQVDQRHQEAA
jgi:hypothetical protein